VYGHLQVNFTVHVNINDVNDNAPVFSQKEYVVDIDEVRSGESGSYVQMHSNELLANRKHKCMYKS
jgi:hypothetical protein